MKGMISGSGAYLLVPVWCGQEEIDAVITIDGAESYSLKLTNMPGQGAKPDFYAAILAPQGCCTHNASVETEDGLCAEYFSFFSFSEEKARCVADTKERPLIHFTAETGWINDPNGMVFQNGTYHLYFQYNPFNNQWQNMSWGHAVSTDLLHWRQLDTVLYPDAEAFMFSGSGMENTRGDLSLPKDALLFFYTYATKDKNGKTPRRFTQKLAYSTDGGRTLIKKDGVFIDNITEENRDPKVFYHEPSSAYICLLWLEGNTYAILRSTDLTAWEETQRVTFAPAWECPDLFELPCPATGEKKWVFWSADGYYLLGSFDGRTFHAEQDMKHAYTTDLPYAAQTFSGTAEGTVSIAWLRTKNEGLPYRGAMSLPRLFTLVKKDGAFCIAHNPVAQYEASKKLAGTYPSPRSIKLPNSPVEVEVLFEEPCDGSFELDALQMPFDIRGERCLHIVCDASLVEITAGDYTAIAYRECAALQTELALSYGQAYTVNIYSVGS